MLGELEKSILLKMNSPSTPKLDKRQSRDGRRSLLRLSEKEQSNINNTPSGHTVATVSKFSLKNKSEQKNSAPYLSDTHTTTTMMSMANNLNLTFKTLLCRIFAKKY